MEQTINTHTALIYVMVTMSAVDRSMTDTELQKIGQLVQTLPVFDGFNPDWLVPTAEDCGAILAEPDGLETVLALVERSLPDRLFETAYALAVEVAAADLVVEQEEIRLLQLIRDSMGLDKLVVAAIERGARARSQVA